MTIASALTALNTDIVNARTAITNKGGTVTVNGGSSQLATDIATIPTGSTPVIQSLNVTPTTSAQTITASGGVDGYSPVNVSAVTASIDANITAGNIKNGVTILGVTGNYSGTTPTGTLSITQNGTYDVTNYASADVSVSGGGAKFGATIDSVIGDIDGNGVLQAPTTPTDLVFTGVTGLAYRALKGRFQASKVTSVSFPALTTISSDEAMYGTFSDARNLTSFSAPLLTSISAINACYDAFKNTALQSINLAELETITGSGGSPESCRNMFSGIGNGLTSLTFPKLKTISGGGVARSMFYGLTSQITPSFPELTTTSGSQCCYGMFQSSKITGISIPKLTTISGSQSWYQFLYGNTVITSLTLPEVTTISGDGAMTYAFANMSSLTRISFPKLATVTGSNPFGPSYAAMFSSDSALTEIHFKSDMQSTISALTGYANKWGASNATIYFDL